MLLEQGLGGMIGGGSGVLSEGGTIMEEVDPNEPVYCTCQRVRKRPKEAPCSHGFIAHTID